MSLDLNEQFLQGRINKARDEIKKVLDNYQLLLSAELNYTTGGVSPIVKLVDNSKEANKETPQENKESN